MTNDLFTLRSRIRAADQGSRELDEEVARACGWIVSNYWMDKDLKISLSGPPAFTSRPNDPSAAMGELERRRWCFESSLKRRRVTVDAISISNGDKVTGSGRTLALAATDALLAAVEREKGESNGH